MNSDASEVQVEQIDRDAAAAFLRSDGHPFDRLWADSVLAGERDEHILVVAFARHRFAAHPAATAMREALEARVSEQISEEAGFWRTCSGCHESEDGHDIGHYPYSAVFQCKLGGGCGDCGGIGATWDSTDYAEMAEWMLERDRTEANIKAVLVEKLSVFNGRIHGLDDAAFEILNLADAAAEKPTARTALKGQS